jgi:hypothetical protein
VLPGTRDDLKPFWHWLRGETWEALSIAGLTNPIRFRREVRRRWPDRPSFFELKRGTRLLYSRAEVLAIAEAVAAEAGR